MTVVLITDHSGFLVVSSDTKPTEGIGAGAKCIEKDTGAQFIFDGTSWTDDLTLIYALSQVIQ